jgi:hypothetical protein
MEPTIGNGDPGDPVPAIETPEEFEAALKTELERQGPPGVELTDEKAQHVSDIDAIYGNLRAHRESLSKLKLLAALSKAGVTSLPHLNSIKTDIKNQRKAIAVLVELAGVLAEDPEAVVPEPSDLEVLSK